MGFNSAFKGLIIYTERSKSICAPDNCIVIIRSPETVRDGTAVSKVTGQRM